MASPSDLAALAGGTSSTGPTVTRLPDSGANGTASFGSQQQPFSYKDENGEDVFYDALTRRLSVTSTTSSACTFSYVYPVATGVLVDRLNVYQFF